MGSSSHYFCNTGLSLGLESFDVVDARKEKKPTSVVSLKFDQVLPSLSLGPSDDQGSSSDNINNNHNNNNNNNNSNNTTSDPEEEEEASPRKKLRLTKDQSAVLEDIFKQHCTLNPNQKQALAKKLNLRPRQVEVWFQNRRARTKLKQTEMDCDVLKKCCERLTEENKRLKKEVQELKSLKLPPLYMQVGQAATLSVCPSCDEGATSRVSGAHHRYADHKPPSSNVFAPGGMINGTKPPMFFPHSSAAC